MVLLTTAAVFAALSIVLFVAGLALGRPEIAMFGAVIMVGVGGMGVVNGYQVETGENTTVIFDNETVILDDISKATEEQTVDVSANTLEPTGISFGRPGANMYLSQTETAEIDRYSVSTTSLSFTTYEQNLSVAGEDASPTGVSVEENGESLFMAGDNTQSVYKYNMSEAHNLSTAALEDSYDLSAYTTSPWDVEFSEDGTNMHVVGNVENEIHEFDLTDPYNLSSVEFERTYTVQQNVDGSTGMSFSEDGEELLLSGNGNGLVFQYELERPYAIETASYTGNVLDASGSVNELSDAEYVGDGEAIVVADVQSDDLTVYDNTDTLTVQTSNNAKQYDDIDSIANFPLELLVMLLGAVMLMSGAGEASESGKRKQ